MVARRQGPPQGSGAASGPDGLRAQRPRARTTRVLTERFEDELLVYDLERHEAHCLNATVAWVWARSDGTRTVAELTAALPETGLPAEPDLVWDALAQLQAAHLLDTPVRLPSGAGNLSRKDALKRLGRAAGLALLLPAVESIVAPVSAQAASCLTIGQCRRLRPGRRGRGCTGLPICNNRRWCCRMRRWRRWRWCTPRRC